MSDDLIGTRVVMRASHPHAGRAGVVSGVERVAGEIAVLVQLDGSYEGSCYAFPGDWKRVTW